MARLTARIRRLERILCNESADGEFADLSEADHAARICSSMERLVTDWRNAGKSIDAMVAEIADLAQGIGRSVDEPMFAPLLAEVRAPAFDAERLLAALMDTEASDAAAVRTLGASNPEEHP